MSNEGNNLVVEARNSELGDMGFIPHSASDHVTLSKSLNLSVPLPPLSCKMGVLPL